MVIKNGSTSLYICRYQSAIYFVKNVKVSLCRKTIAELKNPILDNILLIEYL